MTELALVEDYTIPDIANVSDEDLRRLSGQQETERMPRLSINHSAENADGDDLPRGKWMVTDQDGVTVYADEVLFQPLLKRFSFSVWDNDENRFSTQTIQAPSMNSIFYDSVGGEKCGKLPKPEIEKLKKGSAEAVAQASIKCNQIFYGLATIKKGVNEKGKKAKCENVPCIWYAKGMSFMPVADYFKVIDKQKRTMCKTLVALGKPERHANGTNVYYSAGELTTDGDAPFGTLEQATFGEFAKMINGFNQKIMAEYHKKTNHGKDIDLAQELEDDAA